MKKAKLMVSAIAIFAVLGAAVATKASKFENHVIYTGASATDCITLHAVAGATIAAGTPNVFASTTTNVVNCPSVFTTTIDDNQ